MQQNFCSQESQLLGELTLLEHKNKTEKALSLKGREPKLIWFQNHKVLSPRIQN